MILLYHHILEDADWKEDVPRRPGLPLGCFREQLDWLRRHRRVVPLDEYLRITDYGRRAARGAVAITFDDGLADTFRTVYPVLRDEAVPATFFISTSHLGKGQPLWFSYVDALCFEGVYDELRVDDRRLPLSSPDECRMAKRSIAALARASGTPQALQRRLAGAYPLPASVTERYTGMSHEDLAIFGRNDLLECGAHTVTHPFLDLLASDEQAQEIVQCRQRLAELTGRPVRYFAYPNGDYNRQTLRLVKEAGYEAAFATTSKRLEPGGRFEIGRTGIYSTSFAKFWLKVHGVAKPRRRAR